MSIITESDKSFWHHYEECYEKEFSRFPSDANIHILEIGVFKGNSIRMLMNRFPNAEILGIDILQIQESWPISPKVKYEILDTSDRIAFKKFLSDKSYDIIIDDGSHIPSHQSYCLYEGIKKLKKGGLYILEDIHTSLPDHDIYKNELNKEHSAFKFKNKQYLGTALTTLLAIKHIKDCRLEITDEHLQKISKNNFLLVTEIQELFENISDLYLFRRNDLPTYCYRCNSNIFEYSNLKCTCGIGIFSNCDSMSFIIKK